MAIGVECVKSFDSIKPRVLSLKRNLSLVMRKLDFCKCENKDADQLSSNCAADQRLCFHYIDSTIPLLPKFEISCLQPSSVVVQPGSVSDLVRNPEDRFSRDRTH